MALATMLNALVALFLLPHYVNSLLSQKDYLVSSDLLPGLSSIDDQSLIPQMYAGHLPLGEEEDTNTKHYFFWKFHDTSGLASSSAANTLIFWLNGGPGCSSMDGALMESGPFRVNDDGKLHLNNGSWHTRGDLVFVDQPAGTGFSTVGEDKDYDDDLALVSQRFIAFLENYFTVFPEDYSKNIVISGESYAGQFIPFFADAILDYNEENPDSRFNLHSLLIGNGWIDPNSQSLSYVPFAVDHGLIDKSDSHFKDLLRYHEDCQNLINSGTNEGFSYDECENILTHLLDYTVQKKDSEGNKVDDDQQCLNMYDYRLRDSYPSCGMNWPGDLPNISKFFSTEGVLEALNLDSSKVPSWRECDGQVSSHLTNPKSKPSIHLLPSLLESGLQIVLFNGDKDIICNNYGVESLIDSLEWGGVKGFTNEMQYYNWVYRDSDLNFTVPAGSIKYERNLTFINVYNASHMVPFDNALVSRGIVDIYLNDVQLVEDGNEDTLVSEGFVKENKAPESDVSEGKQNEKEEENGKSDSDGDNKDDKDDKDDDDHDDGHDDDHDDDDHDDDHDDDGDDDHDDDGDDEDDDKGEHKKGKHHDSDDSGQTGKFTMSVIYMLLFSVIGVALYYFAREYFRPKIRAILVDPNKRHDSHKKTVSWADDLEQGDAELQGTDTKGKKKGGYTGIPNTDDTGDDSFELDDL